MRNKIGDVFVTVVNCSMSYTIETVGQRMKLVLANCGSDDSVTEYIPWLGDRMKHLLNGKNQHMNGNIDKAFKELISQRSIHDELGVTSSTIRNLRYKVNNDIPISTDRKIELLKKSGWHPEGQKFTKADLVSLLNYYKRTSEAARSKGPEHVIEQWEIVKSKKN